MKTIKLIATLGITAGLGIASIPAFSYAADVSGDVQIEAEITPAIAMRIHSNEDQNLSGDDIYGVIKYNPTSAKILVDSNLL